MKMKCLGTHQAFRRQPGERGLGVCVCAMEACVEAKGSAGQVSGVILCFFSMQGRCLESSETLFNIKTPTTCSFSPALVNNGGHTSKCGSWSLNAP